jgi:hypothetical protein
MPDCIHEILIQKQAEFKEKGKFVSLERIIYILLKENSKKT